MCNKETRIIWRALSRAKSTMNYAEWIGPLGNSYRMAPGLAVDTAITSLPRKGFGESHLHRFSRLALGGYRVRMGVNVYCAGLCFVVVALGFLLTSVIAEVQAVSNTPPAEMDTLLASAVAKTVKITGAGGYLGLEPYQSGIIISPDGLVLTVWSHVLLEGDVAVTLSDGRRFPGELVGIEPSLELAVLRVDTSTPEWFDLSTNSAEIRPGQWVFALHNAFGVAVGHEPVSIQRGTVAGRGLLEGKRGGAGAALRSEVIFLDFVTSTPGAAGGAVVDCSGRLVGIIGKAVFHESSRVWASYAIPAELLAKALRGVLVNKTEKSREAEKPSLSANLQGQVPREGGGPTPENLGLRLVPVVMPNIPAFVDWVVPNSPAEKAGLRPDDLIVTVNGQIVRTVGDFRRTLQALGEQDKIVLGVDRKGQFLYVELSLKK